MSEINKNQIVVDIPKGYKECDWKAATHILLGRDCVKEIQYNHNHNCNHDTYIICPYTGDIRSWDWIERHRLAYLRLMPKPEPFRANFIDKCIPFKTYESDSHGHVTDIVTSYCIELPGGAVPCRKGMRLHVNIEEIIEE